MQEYHRAGSRYGSSLYDQGWCRSHSRFLTRRIAIVERGPLKGREQEWNLSRKELAELVEQGLLTASDADECVASEFNPVRAGFYGGRDVWTENVLNIGVRPDRIIAKVAHCTAE